MSLDTAATRARQRASATHADVAIVRVTYGTDYRVTPARLAGPAMVAIVHPDGKVDFE